MLQRISIHVLVVISTITVAPPAVARGSYRYMHAGGSPASAAAIRNFNTPGCRHCFGRLLSLRAGSQAPSTPLSGYPPPPTNNYDPSVPQFQQGYAAAPAGSSEIDEEVPFPPSTQQGGGYYYDENDPFHETVQDRVDSWRRVQMEKAAAAASAGVQESASPRDEQGRLKLMTSVSKGSRAIIFFILMFRDIHLFELADQNFKGLRRLFMVTPLILLFIGNMAGVVATFTSPSHSAKKRLKAILNLDKVLEALLICFYLGRLTLFPSPYTPREIYVSNTLHSVFFILQSQAFTRLSWDDTAPKPIGAAAQTYYSSDPTPPVQGQQQYRQQQHRPGDGWFDGQPSHSNLGSR